MDIPQILTGKQPNQHLNIIQVLPLPAQSPFGNLMLKHFRTLDQLDHINLKLLEIFQRWNEVHTKPGIFLRPFHHQILIEEAIYFLRKIADDLIGLHFLLYILKSTDEYPKKIEIDSIGSLLHTTKHKDFCKKFSLFKDGLEILNDLSNAYKHSFLNSDLTIDGKDEPCAIALHLHYNDLNKKPRFYIVRVAEIIENYNKFYSFIINSITENNPGHRFRHDGT